MSEQNESAFPFVVELLQGERYRLKGHIRTVCRNMDVVMSNIPIDQEREELKQVEAVLAILEKNDD
jgi:hypothetical protein